MSKLTVLAAVGRTTKLKPLWCSGLLAVTVIGVPLAFRTELDFLDATLTLHLAMFVLLLGAAFVLDDPARELTEVLPHSAKQTVAIRMGLALIPVAGFWAVLLWLAPYTVRSQGHFPRAGLAVEAFAVLCWVWAVAAVGGRRAKGSGGPAAAIFLVVCCAVMAMLPEGVTLFVPPGAPAFAGSRLRWTALLLLGVVALIYAIWGSRPFGRRTGLRLRPR